MPNAIVDGVTYELPPDDSQAQKIPQLNAVIQALAGQHSTGIAWTSWAPTWVNVTVGNGVVTARYTRVGKLIVCRLVFVLGSTSAVSGDFSFTLPVTRAADAGVNGVTSLGPLTAYDLSTDTPYDGVLVNTSTTTCKARFPIASGTYITRTAASLPSATVPFTWATGDEVGARFWYEAA